MKRSQAERYRYTDTPYKNVDECICWPGMILASALLRDVHEVLQQMVSTKNAPRRKLGSSPCP
jgi:hypothetical protein